MRTLPLLLAHADPDRVSLLGRLHPGVKSLSTFGWVVVVASHPPDAVTPLLPHGALLLLVWSMAGVPGRPLLRQLLPAAPFVLTVALFQPLFDTAPVLLWDDMSLRHGWLVALAMILRLYLVLAAVFLLVATTRPGELTAVAARLGVSPALLATLSLLYRYLFLLADEITRMRRAVRLRLGQDRPLPWHVAAALIGQLLLRCRQRAEHVDLAMRARGFTGRLPLAPLPRVRAWEYAAGMLWFGVVIGCRLTDPMQHLGMWLLGIGFYTDPGTFPFLPAG
ncbi:MAG: cobalt ECF transporter T component CbiQ [Magnetococcales bacterium]|nr:cobalt ECF transporter T component CbiQ [Magnetococcales bacterium]